MWGLAACSGLHAVAALAVEAATDVCAPPACGCVATRVLRLSLCMGLPLAEALTVFVVVFVGYVESENVALAEEEAAEKAIKAKSA